MSESSENDKNVEELVRASPDIKSTGAELLRESRSVDEGAGQDQAALNVVVWEAGLFVELF